MDKTLNILVVENNNLIQRAMQRMLKGHNVTVVGSGEDAIETLVDKPYFDVIVSDYNLDGYIDGGMLLEWLKTKKPDLVKKFIFLSANDLAREMAEEEGVPYLSKPATLSEVMSTIEQVSLC